MRAELLGRVAAAQFDLENALAELARSGAATGPARDQLQALSRLQRQIGTADLAALATLRSDVSAAIATPQALAQEARTATAEATTADALGLTGAGNASRAEVAAVMQSMHRFDPYLHFSSPDEEEAYRQREAERRAFIEAEQAKHTPAGDLNAAGGTIGQMVDAKTHGAGDSPEFQQRWNNLVATTEKLRDAVRRSGGSTAEFDDHLREDLRRILKSKGVSDAQIDEQFAAHPDPLEAAKAFVAGNDDVATIGQAARRAAATDSPHIHETDAPPLPPAPLSSAIAKLAAAGVGVDSAPCSDADNFEHGVAPRASVAQPVRAR